MSDTPLQDAIADIGKRGPGADLRVTATPDAQRVEGRVDVALGDEVTLGAGGYWQRTKRVASEWAGWLGLSWRPRD